MSLKISVVMPSYLGEYPFCAKNREDKFKRAVDSFINQSYVEKELLIISDGCEKTIMCAAEYAFNPQIKVYQIPKQELFSGAVRNTGIFYATGDVICYLDADDYIGSSHLGSIANAFLNNNDDWVYFDDEVIYNFNPYTKEILSKARREARIEHGSIGTSNIAHRKKNEFNWHLDSGYGHDWTFIQKLIKNNPNPKKIDGTQYFVCHIPSSVDS